MTYNIKNGGRDDGDDRRLDAVIDVVVGQAPDVLVMQELRQADLDGHAVLHRLENETGLRAFLAIARTGFHVAVFVPKTARVLASWADDRGFHHTTRTVVVATGRGPLAIVGAHLCPFSGTVRLAEARRLLGRMPLDGMTLLMGDLNALDPWSDHRERVRALPPRYRSRHRRRIVGGEVDTRAVAALVDGGLVDLARDRPGGDPHGDGQRYTAPTRQGGAEFAKMRVDYIFGTRPVAALATGCRVVGGDTADRASDHYPVVAEFDLNL